MTATPVAILLGPTEGGGDDISRHHDFVGAMSAEAAKTAKTHEDDLQFRNLAKRDPRLVPTIAGSAAQPTATKARTPRSSVLGSRFSHIFVFFVALCEAQLPLHAMGRNKLDLRRRAW